MYLSYCKNALNKALIIALIIFFSSHSIIARTNNVMFKDEVVTEKISDNHNDDNENEYENNSEKKHIRSNNNNDDAQENNHGHGHDYKKKRLEQRRNHIKKEKIRDHRRYERESRENHCCNNACGVGCMSYSMPRYGMSFGMGVANPMPFGVPTWQWPGYYYNRPYMYGGFGPWATVPYWSAGFAWSV